MRWFFCPKVPEPDPPQSFPEWRFSNGTVVHAHSFDSAIQFLRKSKWGDTSKVCASETESGLWDVQFDEYVSVESVPADTFADAVKSARQKISVDASIIQRA